MAAVHERREFMDCGDDLELLQHKVGVGNYRLVDAGESARQAGPAYYGA